MIEFTPKPCPCGCKKWIMSPLFGCQCSSISEEEKDEFMAMVRDAIRYRELRLHKVVIMNDDSTYIEQSQTDMVVDILVITNKGKEGR